MQNRGGEIGTTAHRLREDHFGRVCAESIGDANEVGESAAKAAPSDLARIETACSRKLGVYQRIALIVHNDGAAEASFGEQACGGENKCRFPRPEKSTHDNQVRTFGHAVSFRTLPAASFTKGSGN